MTATASTSVKRTASVRLSASLNSALNQQAKQLQISKDALVRRTLANMLEEAQDIEDAKRVLTDIKSGKENSATLAQVKAELGL